MSTNLHKSTLKTFVLIRGCFMSTNLHESTPKTFVMIRGLHILRGLNEKRVSNETLYLGDPPEARTQDPHIKSVMLYLLS